jgi:hypothetical protein
VLLSALALMILPSKNCEPERAKLEVTFFTQIHADGSCTRRTEYRLTRGKDRDKTDRGWKDDASSDPLVREFKVPTSADWLVTDTVGPDSHERHVEALLSEVKEIEGDFSRIEGPGAGTTRNYVSFDKDGSGEGAEYDYLEVLVDPNSPLLAMRQLLPPLERHWGAIAGLAAARLIDRRIAASDIRKAYEDGCLVPLRKKLDAVSNRQAFGPAERRLLLGEGLDCDRDVEAQLLKISPGEPAPIHDALEEAEKELPLEDDLLALGWIAFRAFDADSWNASSVEITFHATVMMPAPIRRANTCFQGAIAQWDFAQGDLYGRGFEMRVFAK